MTDNSKFKLYYNDDGTVICYAMTPPLFLNQYINITAEEFARCDHTVRVHNGKILRSQDAHWRLTESDSGTPCDPEDVSIVVNFGQEHILWEYTLVNK
jgi:hypothetical protein